MSSIKTLTWTSCADMNRTIHQMRRTQGRRVRIFPHVKTMLFLAAALLISSCGGKKAVISTGHVRQLPADRPANVTYYALPQTVFVVDVEVKQTTETPGPYAEYAGTYLGLDEVIMLPSRSHEITNIHIHQFAEPDPEHIYFVRFPESEEQAFFIRLGESGLIYSVNSPADPLSLQDLSHKQIEYDAFGSDKTFHFFLDSALKERIDTITEQVPMDTLSVQRQTLRRSWVEKSQELRARDVADYIMEIREKKFDLISGFQEINYSKEALEYMYSQMTQMESDYLDLFTGITRSDITNYRFMVRPVKEGTQGYLLSRFSSQKGMLEIGDREGQELSLIFQKSGATSQLQRMMAARQDPGRGGETGFHYRIPEYADVFVFLGNEKRAESRALVSQFGVVTRLPAENLHIEFHPETGSIKSVGHHLLDTRD